ncbi:MAG: bifunctional diguanylate cyclase/phosphodiesterase, partial [Pseudomonadota bacterium]|nr:bifunctional diguanylate cyclase/phosphodiesterase [Pseudomonadota bacterium]
MNHLLADPASPDLSMQVDWLRALAQAGTPRDVAGKLVQLGRSHPDCVDAQLFWGLAAGQLPSCEAPSSETRGAANLALARAAVAGSTREVREDGHIAIALADRSDAAVLVLALRAASGEFRMPPEWADLLHIADGLMRRALLLETLQGSVAGLERAEKLQHALFAISDLAGSDRAMPDLLKGIHAILGTLMYAENFYIVRLDAESGMVRFLYWVDVQDPTPADVLLSERQGTMTWYLLHFGKPLHGSTDQLRAQVSGLHSVGTDSNDWLGVPLLRDNVAQGALVLQSYEP